MLLLVGNSNNNRKSRSSRSNTVISLSSLASSFLTPSLLVSKTSSTCCWSILILLLLSGSSGGFGRGGIITYTTSSSSILFADALLLQPVMATSSPSSSSSSHDETATTTNTCKKNNQICTNNNENQNQNDNNDHDNNNIQEIIGKHHPDDDQLLLYHYESTPSTQDEAKKIAKQLSSQLSSQLSESSESKPPPPPPPRTFCVTTTIQSNGKGTTGRKWLGTPGNVFVTIGIPVNVWMQEMMQNRNIPLTLLPLKIGDLTASLINSTLTKQQSQSKQQPPIVTVKWPNDVLVDGKKISGTLIESSDDWFLIGIGINVAYAPPISKTGTDYGRPSQQEIDIARDMGVQLALDFHRWIYDSDENAESIVEGWKNWLDYDMELIMRNDKNPPLDEIEIDNQQQQQQQQKQKQTQTERVVKIIDVLPDGRIRVQNQDEFGIMEVLVSDYFV
ncbi:class II aaRS and biotin synthetase [Fragilariopsis cylindrus CCMP1102]|uniref:Class II aaRS and biotin synthetase n=1 Tax=Fragilariopsis cylindrus CCMP1102 TaxID=635003 RepID=A0A1E7FYT4_9STRA|nr:class II aaRS and biotin synthetase [Fragilariopsis cylindrus CCMP1102]|eukprot:OEU22983.1 class II aaRS and biotin synthetase [Fragilariopsis cylindrus CCMP1102]